MDDDKVNFLIEKSLKEIYVIAKEQGWRLKTYLLN